METCNFPYTSLYEIAHFRAGRLQTQISSFGQPLETDDVLYTSFYDTTHVFSQCSEQDVMRCISL